MLENYIQFYEQNKNIIEISTSISIINPRNIIRKEILKLLYFVQEFVQELVQEPLKLITLAIDIEKSCYNASIQISKKSEEPPHRNWDSPIFLDIYSTRCGTILNILNSNSVSCKTYGDKLLKSILNGSLNPNEIGFMNEKELCPESILFECAEIEKRMGQKIEEKVSTLFQCPFCKQRKCSFKAVQLRCSDEPPNYKCVCLNPECLRRFEGKS